MLSQDPLRHDFLRTHKRLIDGLSTPLQKHALVWCLHYLVPLSQLEPSDSHIVFYEALCLKPDSEIPKIFQRLGHTFDGAVFEGWRAPSSTSSKTSASLTGSDKVSRWQQVLTGEEVVQVLSVVAELGLSRLYGDDPLPLTEEPLLAR